MRLVAIGVIASLTVACAATYAPPTSITPRVSASVPASKSRILRVAKKVLVMEGYQITSSDESAGIVSTALRNLRVTPQQADCGKTMGLDYLKDPRTATRVGFGVVAEEDKVTVNATIEGEYRPGAVDQNITLTCVSHGQLEKELISKITADLAE